MPKADNIVTILQKEFDVDAATAEAMALYMDKHPAATTSAEPAQSISVDDMKRFLASHIADQIPPGVQAKAPSPPQTEDRSMWRYAGDAGRLLSKGAQQAFGPDRPRLWPQEGKWYPNSSPSNLEIMARMHQREQVANKARKTST